jgi:hypothetical protein
MEHKTIVSTTNLDKKINNLLDDEWRLRGFMKIIHRCKSIRNIFGDVLSEKCDIVYIQTLIRDKN